MDASLEKLASTNMSKFNKYASPSAVNKAVARQGGRVNPLSAKAEQDAKARGQEYSDLLEMQSFFEKIMKARLPKVQGNGAVVKGILDKCANIKAMAESGKGLVQRHIQQIKKMIGKA